LAMSHRGRLSVMVNIVGRPASEMFAKFEDVDPRSTLGGGDVKYHVGATGVWHGREGKTVNLHLVSNPSHLEAVDPVAMGACAPSRNASAKTDRTKFCPSSFTATPPLPARACGRRP